jgi:3-hydroxymyristoyl/3-hydroxydecanoyl-(acyl carrier protein) dehydratase
MKIDIEEIKKLIPHRDPFLFVDTCEIIIPGEHGKSEKIFSNNEYFF